MELALRDHGAKEEMALVIVRVSLRIKGKL